LPCRGRGRWSGEAETRQLQEKVALAQVDVAGELDLELGGAVGIGAAADHRVAADGGEADGGEADLGGAGQRRVTDEGERLVTGEQAVRVDQGEGYLVRIVGDVRDQVAAGAADRAVLDTVQVVDVVAGA
jgi:hypothetical protein